VERAPPIVRDGEHTEAGRQIDEVGREREALHEDTLDAEGGIDAPAEAQVLREPDHALHGLVDRGQELDPQLGRCSPYRRAASCSSA
jgi:hypothetical protein